MGSIENGGDDRDYSEDSMGPRTSDDEPVTNEPFDVEDTSAWSRWGWDGETEEAEWPYSHGCAPS